MGETVTKYLTEIFLTATVTEVLVPGFAVYCFKFRALLSTSVDAAFSLKCCLSSSERKSYLIFLLTHGFSANVVSKLAST